MKTTRIAVATNGKKGLQDTVSEVFGRAKTFTLLDVKDNKIIKIYSLENSTADFHHGAGPIAIKMLVDNKVDIVVANQLGIGASELLKQHNIELVPMKPRTRVANAILQTVNKMVKTV